MSEYLVQPPHSIGMPASIASTWTGQDDRELVAASKVGNQDAFAQLVQRHQRRVFNLVFRMLQEYEETNEVTQEKFLAAWQGLS